MTHDELLAKIEVKGNHPFATLQYNEVGQTDIQAAFSALRAVVAIHTPFEKMTGAAWTPSNGITEPSSELYCRHCSNTGSLMPNYPCPTIQAIQKVLG